MEWLRSCYRSRRRLFVNALGVITKGAYYRCPQGTPHLPFPHHYGSLNWLRGTDFFVNDGLGEVAEPVGAWTNGVWPGPFPLAQIAGTKLCLQTGEQYPPVNVQNVFGLPRGCFQLQSAVIPADPLTIDIGQPNIQVEKAQLLSWLYDHPDSIAAFFAAWLGPLASVTTVPNDATVFPGSTIIVTPAWTQVVISGTSNPQQLALQVMQGANSYRNYGAYGTLELYNNAATVILGRMVAAGVTLDRPLILAGHSYGGAVAALVAARVRLGNPDASIQLLTFGSPSPGDTRLIAILDRQIQQIHLANDGDPVPGLPPAPSDLANLAALLPGALLTLWGRFSGLHGRQVQASDGTLSPWEGSPLTWAFLVDAVARILVGRPWGVIDAHQMEEYLRRARLRLAPEAKYPIDATAQAALKPSPILQVNPIIWTKGEGDGETP